MNLGVAFRNMLIVSLLLGAAHVLIDSRMAPARAARSVGRVAPGGPRRAQAAGVDAPAGARAPPGDDHSPEYISRHRSALHRLIFSDEAGVGARVDNSLSAIDEARAPRDGGIVGFEAWGNGYTAI